MVHLLLLFVGYLSVSLERMGSVNIEGEDVLRFEVRDRGEAQVLSRLEGDEWVSARSYLRYREGDGVELQMGDVVTARCRVWGFHGRQYCKVLGRDIFEIERSDGEPWHRRINDWCSARLHSLGLSEDGEAVCQAMLLARRESLTPSLIGSYRESGAAHILAVSGFHVMILCFVMSRLFLVLHLVPRGFLYRPLFVAGAVWCYAMVVGMGASVMRAAIMFIIMQLLHFFRRSYKPHSGLAIALIVIILYDPLLYFDVGFALSFVAVLSILVWVMPLYGVVTRLSNRVFNKRSIVRRLWLSLIMVLLVGVACALSTMPIVSWAFGYVSPMGVLLNPLITITAYLLLMLSLLWVFVGFEFLAPLLRGAIDWVASVQNGAVEVVSRDWESAVDLRLSGEGVVAIYVIYIVATIVVRRWWQSHKGDT